MSDSKSPFDPAESNPQFNIENIDPPPPYEDVVAEGSLAPATRPDTTLSLEKSQSASSSVSNTNEDNNAFLAQALEFTRHAAPQNASEQYLRRPVVIPQVSPGNNMPFSRGYSPDLMAHGISMEEFVEFIDNYNVVSQNSQPFAILDLAGGVVGFVPIHHAQIISGAISLASHAGNMAVGAVKKSKATTFLESANNDFFNPRGLNVEIATSAAVKARLGMDPDVPLAASYEESDGLDMHERRMLSVRNYAAPVTFDVPPPNEETNMLKRMAAAQQKRVIKKNEEEAMKDRAKYAEKKAEADQKISKKGEKIEKDLRKLDASRQKEMNKRDKGIAKLNAEIDKEARKEPKKAESLERERTKESQKIEKDFEKEMRKLDEEGDKIRKEYDKETGKESKDAQKEDKEIKASSKILWILVEAHAQQ